MNVKPKILIFLLLEILLSTAATATKWHSYLSYYQVIATARNDQKIFAANENGLFSCKISDKSFETYSRVEGLSDSGISSICWSASAAGLLIGYTSGNLDLLIGEKVLNLPDIKFKGGIASRSIHNIFCEGDYAWLSCDFGIVKINLKKWEVAETWIIGPEANQIAVRELAVDAQYFWAATEAGVFKAERINPNLQDYHNWTLQNQIPSTTKNFSSITILNKQIYVCDSNGKSYEFDGISWHAVYPEITGILKIKALNTILAFICNNRIELYGPGRHTSILNYATLTPSSSGIYPTDALIANNGELWIGDHTYGLIHNSADGSFISAVPSSPANNNATRLTIAGPNLYVATASENSAATALPAEIHRLIDQHWFSLNQYTKSSLAGLINITGVVQSPSNADHFWASTKGIGLLEFNGADNVKIYNSNNSTLESLNGVCKTGGLKIDLSGNLWVTNGSVKHQLHVVKPDGTLKSLTYPGIDNQFVAAGELIIAKTDTKWIIVNNSDLFALRTGSTPDIPADDQYRKTSVRSRFSNSETTIIKGYNLINALSEDQDGYLWVGTENGVVLYSNPESIFGNTDFYGIQPSVDLGDGLYHPLLENITVTSIAVDGGNRKWFGTTNSGVFLYSADGSRLIEHFNTANSPLFSDHINSIAINGESGEIFFATALGLISWKGNAIEAGESFTKLYVWPNPVRETYQGDISIDGLTAESTVKITDIAGSLVYKTTSNGGRATWDGKGRNGKRVNTGVYLIFCADSNGDKSRVLKLLFIH